MEQQSDDFKLEDRKLEIYMKNVENAIVLLEANAYSVHLHLISLLKKYGTEYYDFADCKETFIPLIQKLGSGDQPKTVCFYNFQDEAISYDVVKSLNISREILRRVGVLIFIMRYFLVRQIENEEPNLFDYITLRLDYRYPFKPCFVPRFAISYQERYTKTERHELKKKALLQEQIQSIRDIDQYDRLLTQYRFKRMSVKEKTDLLEKQLWEANVIIHDHTWENPRRQVLAQEDLWMQTAEILCIQGYLEDAWKLFDEMDQLLETFPDISLYRLHVYEGKAYCSYYSRSFAQARTYLAKASDLLERMDGSDEKWLCRIWNDIGSCYYNERDYQSALEIWQKCAEDMDQKKFGNPERIYRNTYNRLLAHLRLNTNVKVYHLEWNRLGNMIEENFPKQSEIYAEYRMVSAWLEGMVLGRSKYAESLAQEALRIHRMILPENDYRLALNYHILGCLNFQMLNLKKASEYQKTSENILKNCTVAILPEQIKGDGCGTKKWD